MKPKHLDRPLMAGYSIGQKFYFVMLLERICIKLYIFSNVHFGVLAS